MHQCGWLQRVIAALTEHVSFRRKGISCSNASASPRFQRASSETHRIPTTINPLCQPREAPWTPSWSSL